MTILARNKNKDVDYLLGNNYEGVHARLVKVLGERRAALFAQPQNRRTKGEHWWSAADGPRFEPFLSASDEIKDEVSDVLRAQTDDVREDILKDSELRRLGEKIFIFPGEGNLYYRDNGAGGLDLVICQWGCRRAGANNNAGPLVHIVNRPKKDHSDLTLAVEYSNGDPYAEKLLQYRYKDRNKEKRSNAEGQVLLGQMKNGDAIVIVAEESPDFTHSQTVVNSGEVTVHRIILPFYFSPRVEVVNQRGERLTNYGVAAEYNDKRTVHQSDEEGAFSIANIILDGTPLELSDADNANIRERYVLDKSDEVITFTVTERFYAPVTLELLNDTDEKVPGFDLNLVIEGRDLMVTSDDEGMVRLSDVPEEGILVVKKQGGIVARQEFAVEEGENHFTVRVNPPIPKRITVTLIDHKDKPVPDTAIDLTAKAGLVQDVTNEEGKMVLVDPPFVDQEKIKTKVFLKREGKKPKAKSTRFFFREEQQDYVIKIKKRNWWWLLLLLLPLLLLIRCEKEITVELYNETAEQYLADQIVHLDYDTDYLYAEGSFPYNRNNHLTDTTSVDGRATFSGLQYSVWSWLFKRNSPLNIYAANDTCYVFGMDTVFHSVRNKSVLQIQALPQTVNTDLVVVDKKDGDPLPDATVGVIIEMDGARYTRSGKTDAAGRFYLKDVPVCGVLTTGVGSLYGYGPDSLTNVPIADFVATDQNERKLRLPPITEQLTFFVVDCKSGRGIPGAKAEVTLTYRGKEEKQKVTTNTRGKGKGIVEEARLLSDLAIIVNKSAYYSAGEYNRNVIPVEEFIRLPDSARTICLEPLPQSVTLFTKCELSRGGYEGAVNVVTITNGDKVKKDTILSGRGGAFNIIVIAGDQVSVRSSYPAHEVNNTKIRDAVGIDLLEKSEEERSIYLPYTQVKISLKTVDAAYTTKAVPGVNLTCKMEHEGKTIAVPDAPLRSDADGNIELLVPKQGYLSLVAKKERYKDNDFTISRLAIESIKPDQANEVPMEKAVKEYTITVHNKNAKKDEVFDLYVNGVKVGRVSHITNREERTSYKVEMPTEKVSTIKLRLINTFLGGSDTGAILMVEELGLQAVIKGKNKDHVFKFNPMRGILR